MVLMLPASCKRPIHNCLHTPPMPKMLMTMMRHRLHSSSSTLQFSDYSDVVEDVESPKHSASLPLSRFCTSTHSPTSSARIVCSAAQGMNGARQMHCQDGGTAGGGGGSKALQSWRQKLEDCLWLASAVFILYYGDFRSDFFTLLAHDARVLRTPLHMGLICLMLDTCAVTLYIAMMGNDHPQQKPCFHTRESRTDLKVGDSFVAEAAADVNIQMAMLVIGFSGFILMCIALWPIWRFLTIPMLFTLFMAITVVAPYIAPSCSKVKLAHQDGHSATSYSFLSTSEHLKS